MLHNGKGCLIENESRIVKSNQVRTRKEIKTVQKDSNAVRKKVKLWMWVEHKGKKWNRLFTSATTQVQWVLLAWIYITFPMALLSVASLLFGKTYPKPDLPQVFLLNFSEKYASSKRSKWILLAISCFVVLQLLSESRNTLLVSS